MLTLRPGIRGTPARIRVRALLAVAQIALAVVLLSAGGLLTRTIVGLLRADLGVEPRGVVVSQWMLTSQMNFEAASKQRWMEHVLERVRGDPGRDRCRGRQHPAAGQCPDRCHRAAGERRERD
jgi:hypothetical protein